MCIAARILSCKGTTYKTSADSSNKNSYLDYMYVMLFRLIQQSELCLLSIGSLLKVLEVVILGEKSVLILLSV